MDGSSDVHMHSFQRQRIAAEEVEVGRLELFGMLGKEMPLCRFGRLVGI